MKHPDEKLLDAASLYVDAIIAPGDTNLLKLECPVPSGDRYEHLRFYEESDWNAQNIEEDPLKYFFALDLYQCAYVLARLLGSILEAMKFLGPQHCALSIVEGRSKDGTFETLLLLTEQLDQLGVRYFLQSNERNPQRVGGGATGDRIEALVILRNQALQPLVDLQLGDDTETTVVFVNDVAICMEDMLELIYQRYRQNADMTCAMDWEVGAATFFYDAWISRGINGDSFFPISPDGNWDNATNLFWNDPKTLKLFNAGRPFQVFSCWNGAVTFTAKPIIQQKIQFRNAPTSECLQGEPVSFCKDLWIEGYGRIAVIPSVNLAYSNEKGREIKASKGYVTDFLGTNEDKKDKIEWEEKPPEKVKCIPSWTNQYWVPWNNTQFTE